LLKVLKKERKARSTPIWCETSTLLYSLKKAENVILLRKMNGMSKIKVYFPENWRYLTNPNFLQVQKQADVKDFVFRLLNLSEFDTKNKDIAKSKVAETKKEIASLDVLLQEYEKVQEPTKVEDLTESFNKKIEAVRKKINVPTLSDADVLHNSKIEKQIAEIQAQQPEYQDFEEEIKLPVLFEKSYLPLNDVSELEREIENLKNKEYNNPDNDSTLNFALEQNAKKNNLEAKNQKL